MNITKRISWISYLRVLAMFMVLYPHLIAYRYENALTMYFAFYFLNPLHIVQCMGGVGVGIFLITSGYLSVKKECWRNKLYKSVIKLYIEVFITILFSFLIVTIFTKIFKLLEYSTTYTQYSMKDWFETALLIRNFMYKESTEPVLWFLIPFLLYKVLLVIFDSITNNRKEWTLYLFYITFIILIVLHFMHIPNVYLFSERIFYISIILLGYIMRLYHESIFDRLQLILHFFVCYLFMMALYHNTFVGIDKGYIVSVIYSFILFYIFLKESDKFADNKFIKVIDGFGLSFFLLHSNIGWVIIQGLYNTVFYHRTYLSIFLGLISCLSIIYVFHYGLMKYVDGCLDVLEKRLFK